jgi:hypothetical protein
MTRPRSFQLETTGDSATLYVFRPLGRDDASSVARLCAGLPQSVRTLRVDMRDVAWLESDGMEAMRVLLRHWRSSRRGEFRLAFRSANLLATCTGATPPAPQYAPAWTPALDGYSPSMTAAYL